MTIIDARTLEDGARFEADVCIVGAGAAGLTTALELEAPTRRVLLLESGGFEPDLAVQSLYDIESVGYPPRPNHLSRARHFGGSCNLWAGRCMPLQDIDFAGRAWVPDSAWPIPSTAWITRLQPHGADFRYVELAFRWYEAARRLGLDLDIVGPGMALSGYRAVLVPTLPYVSDAALAALREYQGLTLLGPRSGSKTHSFQTPDGLPPGPLQDLLPLRVTEAASLRPGLTAAVAGAQISGRAERWREWLTTELPALASFADGTPALVQAGSRYYLGCWPDEDLLAATLEHLLVRPGGLPATPLPPRVRLRRRGDLTFAFNYGPEPWRCPADADYLLGGPSLAPQDLPVGGHDASHPLHFLRDRALTAAALTRALRLAL